VAEISLVEDVCTPGYTRAGIRLGRISTHSVINAGGNAIDRTVITSVELARNESLLPGVPRLKIAENREAMALVGMLDHCLSGWRGIPPRFEKIPHRVIDN